MTRWWTVGTAARHLGLTRSGVRWLADTRKVRAIRTPSGIRLLSARDVERLRQQRRLDHDATDSAERRTRQ